MHLNIFTCLVAVMASVGIVLAKDCVKITDCSCEFDDGSGIVDLTPIASTDGQPRFYDYVGSWDMMYYSYNPCFPMSMGACSDAAVCKYDSNIFDYVNVGKAAPVTFKFDGNNVILTYVSQSGFDGSTEVTAQCDPGTTIPVIEVYGDVLSNGIAMMTLTSKDACPVPHAKSPSSGGGGLSGGSVLLIIVFVLLVVYCVAGGVFLRVRRDAKGTAMIPNASFWGSLPELIKDGCLFVVGKVRGHKSDYSQPQGNL